MAKFNRAAARTHGHPGKRDRTEPTAVTHEGGPGYVRDPRAELFLLAVTNLVGEPSFYESAGQRDSRFVRLIRERAVTDGEWTARLLGWLRNGAGLRSVALLGAAEFVAARRAAGLDGLSRRVVDSVLRRADEPGELLAHWVAEHGKPPPMPIKKGINDAIRRLWHEHALLKWDSPKRNFRFGDVVELTHPKPANRHQSTLLRYCLDRRRDDADIPAELSVLREHAELREVAPRSRRSWITDPAGAERLRRAGFTWESLAGWLGERLDAQAWESVIPAMGYTALLRNLRNFDKAGISDETAAGIAAKLGDPTEVARSRQLPLAVFAAGRAVRGDRWRECLERAVQHTLPNIPVLRGSTLVLVDTSASMDRPFSRRGSVRRSDAAALFGLALAARCERTEVVSYSGLSGRWRERSHSARFPPRPDEAVLDSLRRWFDDGFMLDGGTATQQALREHYDGHDRVVLLTDEQTGPDAEPVTEVLPESTPVHTFNLAGYEAGHTPAGVTNRHTYGGLNDTCFGLIPLVEAGGEQQWPWEA
ncbi:TROVE domain-containing protein [Actinopolyspora lacussalsi subsp. righensis]|uniref:TROVE domain-containing protein n=1 Tax=Actinopolyspora righensis TaxID=995060 RepID=A0A1I6YBA8_9ACTN|nr:TROVE domain-containing protein [Actinopolyspora righensis]SFT47809.1 TROVE domain-containing protein [Actinopolyspora righensis]